MEYIDPATAAPSSEMTCEDVEKMVAGPEGSRDSTPKSSTGNADRLARVANEDVDMDFAETEDADIANFDLKSVDTKMSSQLSQEDIEMSLADTEATDLANPIMSAGDANKFPQVAHEQVVSQPMPTQNPNPDATIHVVVDHHEMEDGEDDGDETDASAGAASGPFIPEIDFLDKFAFNNGRVGYEHHVPQQYTTGITLHVAGFSPQNRRLDNESETRPRALVPSAEEMSAVKPRRAIDCVWVGMIPSSDKLEALRQGAAGAQSAAARGEEAAERPKKKTRHVGRIVDLNESIMNKVDFDPNAFRVVVRKADKVKASWFYFALLDYIPHTNLCIGYSVKREDVFFFRYFRDDSASSKEARIAFTTSKVKALCFPAETAKSPSPRRSTKTPSESPAPTAATASKDTNLEADRPQVVAKTSPSEGDVDDTGEVAVDQVTVSPTPKKTQVVRAITRASKRKSAEISANIPLKHKAGSSSAAKVITTSDNGESDDNRYPEHSVHPDNEAFRKYVAGLIAAATVPGSHDSKTKNNPVKKVAFQGSQGGATINTHGAIIITEDDEGNTTTHDDDGDDEDDNLQEMNSILRRTNQLVTKLANKRDLGGMRQGLAALESLDDRRAAPEQSVLSLHLQVPTNVANGRRTRFKELLELFPELQEQVDMDSHGLAWMLQGLQITGQSIDMQLVRPYTIAFSQRLKDFLGGSTRKHVSRIGRDKLVDMVVQARNDAEEALLEEAGGFATGPDLKDGEEKSEWTPHAWEAPSDGSQEL